MLFSHLALLLVHLPRAFSSEPYGASDQIVFDAHLGAKPKPEPELPRRRIAVVGAGASGAAAAFFVSRAGRFVEQQAGVREGELLEVVVFEREGRVGGRTTTVHPHDDPHLPPIELGASIFVDANKNLVNAAKLFNLTLAEPSWGQAGIGIWDGTEFRFTTSGKKTLWSGWWDTVAALRRYGPLAKFRQTKAVAHMVARFKRLYDPAFLAARGPVYSIEEFGDSVDLGAQLTTNSGEDWARNEVGVSELWMREIMEASTRVNYASNMDEVHALGAGVSLATGGASVVQGGNWQIFEGMLKASHAKVHLSTEVTEVKANGTSFRLVTKGDKKAAASAEDTFDQVFLAAPWHNLPKISGAEAKSIPKTPYVELHVTLLVTTSPSPNPAYFNIPAGTRVPQTVLTTSAGEVTPEFQSISYHGETYPGSGEWVVKIFSLTKLSDTKLVSLFGDDPAWLLRKTWNAYPKLRPIAVFPPAEPVEGVHYLGALEPWISTMETQTISAREAVARTVHRWWGLPLGDCSVGDAWDFTCHVPDA